MLRCVTACKFDLRAERLLLNGDTDRAARLLGALEGQACVTSVTQVDGQYA